DDDGPRYQGRTQAGIAALRIGERVLAARNPIPRMEIAIGDGDVIGDDHSPADGDALGAHEDGTDPEGVVGDADLARGRGAEFGPRIDAHIRAEAQAWLANAAEAAKAFLALDEASGSHLHARKKRSVIPCAGDLADVHGLSDTRAPEELAQHGIGRKVGLGE